MPARSRGAFYRRNGRNRNSGASNRKTRDETATPEVDDESADEGTAEDDDRANKRVRWGNTDDNGQLVKEEDTSNSESVDENVIQAVDTKVKSCCNA